MDVQHTSPQQKHITRLKSHFEEQFREQMQLAQDRFAALLKQKESEVNDLKRQLIAKNLQVAEMKI